MKRSALTRVNVTPGQLRVLDGLAKGRQLAIKGKKLMAAKNAKLVMDLALKDLDEGHPARGRAKRIALDLPPDTLGRRLTERSVQRILQRTLDTLSVCPIAQEQNARQQGG